MTPAEKILQKALVGSSLDSRSWNGIQAALRDRAFFSSTVAEMKILHAAREMVAGRAAGKLSASEIRRDLRKVIASTGYDPKDARGTIKDLYTKARLDTIIKTNVAQARGFVQRECGMTPGAFGAFPAQELYRLMERKQKRDWAARWRQAYKKVNGEGALQSPCIALKTSPIWTALSAFDHPYPPFDWGSGMDVRDVSADRAIELGLISRDELKGKVRQMEERRDSGAADFNKGLEVDDPHGNLYGELKKRFGDQIRNVDGKVMWRQEVLRETLFTDNFKIALGEPSKRMLQKLSADKTLTIFAERTRGKQLTVTQDWRDTKRPDGTNHLSHFFPEPNNPDNIPLQKDDVELLPSLWRNPDRVRKLQRNLFEAQLDGIDGSILVAQFYIEENGAPRLWTFYKKKGLKQPSSAEGRPKGRSHK